MGPLCRIDRMIKTFTGGHSTASASSRYWPWHCRIRKLIMSLIIIIIISNPLTTRVIGALTVTLGTVSFTCFLLVLSTALCDFLNSQPIYSLGQFWYLFVLSTWCFLLCTYWLVAESIERRPPMWETGNSIFSQVKPIIYKIDTCHFLA